jgi:hypothetical protein
MKGVDVIFPRRIDMWNDRASTRIGKELEKVRRYEQTAGPFGKLRAGSSAAPLAMRLQGPFDYAQGRG